MLIVVIIELAHTAVTRGREIRGLSVHVLYL